MNCRIDMKQVECSISPQDGRRSAVKFKRTERLENQHATGVAPRTLLNALPSLQLFLNLNVNNAIHIWFPCSIYFEVTKTT